MASSRFSSRVGTSLFFGVIGLVLVLIVALPASAIDVFSNTGGSDGTASTVNTTTNVAVGFTVPSGNDYTLNSITLQLANPGSTARSVTPAIYTNSGGNPGTLIQSFNAINLAGSATSAGYTVSPAAAVTLTNGQTYWIVVSATNNSSWEGTNPLTSPLGTFVFVGYRRTSSGGASWATTTSPENKISIDATEIVPVVNTPTPMTTGEPAEVFLCDNLGNKSDGAMTASGGSSDVQVGDVYGSVFCRIIVKNNAVSSSLSEIGVQSVIDQGVLQAVDLFGLLPGGGSVVPLINPVHVCLRGQGSVIYLDAAGVARTPSVLPIDSASPAGYSCVNIPSSGTVVLVGTVSNDQPAAPATIGTLNNCRATTTAMVRLREAATTDSAVLGTLPYQITLDVTAHVPGWYRVIFEDGQGWVSADFVRTVGDCG